MTLDELEQAKNCGGVVDGEICTAVEDDDDEDFPEQSMEADLSDTLYYLEKCLLLMEAITIKQGRIQKIPEGMLETMEEASEWLDQWEYNQ